MEEADRYSLPNKQEVLDAIRTAFSGVDREDGITLHEAEVIDCYGGPEERAAARDLDRDRIWEQVPAHDIASFSYVFPFFDTKAFRYYLPAYMVWVIRHEPSASSTADMLLLQLEDLDTPDPWHKDRLNLLNQDQRKAIALFLLRNSSDAFLGDRVTAAIHRYWHVYLPAKYQY